MLFFLQSLVLYVVAINSSILLSCCKNIFCSCKGNPVSKEKTYYLLFGITV
jgi:hypothetical protein